MAVLASAPCFPARRDAEAGARPPGVRSHPLPARLAAPGGVGRGSAGDPGPERGGSLVWGHPRPCRRGTVPGWSEDQRRGQRPGSSGPASLALMSGWRCSGTAAAPATWFTWWTPPAAPPKPGLPGGAAYGQALLGQVGLGAALPLWVSSELPCVALCIPPPGVGRPSRARRSRGSREGRACSREGSQAAGTQLRTGQRGAVAPGRHCPHA